VHAATVSMPSLRLPLPTVPPYRACELCAHRVPLPGAAGGLGCGCAGAVVPVEQARRRDGLCGPDAAHMLWPRIGAQR